MDETIEGCPRLSHGVILSVILVVSLIDSIRTTSGHPTHILAREGFYLNNYFPSLSTAINVLPLSAPHLAKKSVPHLPLCF